MARIFRFQGAMIWRTGFLALAVGVFILGGCATVSGPWKEALNEGHSNVAMTAPVLSGEPEKIAMTAPVLQEANPGSAVPFRPI
jgi:hypothetical protein